MADDLSTYKVLGGYKVAKNELSFNEGRQQKESPAIHGRAGILCFVAQASFRTSESLCRFSDAISHLYNPVRGRKPVGKSQDVFHNGIKKDFTTSSAVSNIKPCNFTAEDAKVAEEFL